MRLGCRTQTLVLTIAMFISISTALSQAQKPILAAGISRIVQASSPNGDISTNLQPQEGPDFWRSLKAFASRVFSLKEQNVRWPKLELNWRLILAVILGSIGASLCSAGGVGGGGLFIPIFNLLLGFDAKSAAALSNFMILGGSIANVGWNIRQVHPDLPDKPLIDFDVALLLQPNMLLGISIGVICNVIFPSWFIIVEFAITLGYITFRSLRSGLRRWKNETEFANKEKCVPDLSVDAQERGQLEAQEAFLTSSSFNVLTGCVLEEGDVASEEVLKRQNSKNSRSNSLKREVTPPSHSGRGTGNEASEPLLGNVEGRSHFPYAKVLMLGLVWLAFFAVQILRGSKSGPSILNLKPCGRGYWLLTASQLPLAFGLTGWSARHLHKPAKERPQELQEDWELMGPKAFILFPGMALLAGFLGGMLGIGGGMIINPLLIEIGMPPQVTAATCAFMVFFSSSLSVVQFWLLGRIPLDFALLFAGICLVSSLVGLRVVQHAIAKSGRPSIIVFSVSGVLAASAFLTTIFGGLDVWKQYKQGAYMGFHSPC